MAYRASRPRKDDGGTPFTNWLRIQPGLESNTRIGFVGTDLDLVWYNYVKAKFMLIEQKLGEEEYRPSQRTTHSVLDQALRFACTHSEFMLYTPKECLPIPTTIDYCGFHLVRLEDASSDEKNVWKETGRIWIDDRQVSKEKLLRFLKFEWMSDTQSQLHVVPSRQDIHDQTYIDLENLLKDCLLHGDLQNAIDNLKDLIMRYDSLLDNRRIRQSRARKRDELAIVMGQLRFGWN